MDTRALLLGAVISLAACSYSNNSPVTSPNGGEQERLDDSIERDPILDSFERKQPKKKDTRPPKSAGDAPAPQEDPPRGTVSDPAGDTPDSALITLRKKRGDSASTPPPRVEETPPEELDPSEIRQDPILSTLKDSDPSAREEMNQEKKEKKEKKRRKKKNKDKDKKEEGDGANHHWRL